MTNPNLASGIANRAEGEPIRRSQCNAKLAATGDRDAVHHGDRWVWVVREASENFEQQLEIERSSSFVSRFHVIQIQPRTERSASAADQYDPNVATVLEA
jgi:hypothetical protein